MSDPYREWIAERDDEAVMFDGLDDAVVGIGVRCGQPAIVVYDRSRIVRILVDRDGMTDEEACEFCSFNIECGWLGPRTPIVVEMIHQGRQDDLGVDAIQEIDRLRKALQHISEMKDQPLARNLAVEVLNQGFIL